MEMVENLEEWSETFEANWLKHYRETGKRILKFVAFNPFAEYGGGR